MLAVKGRPNLNLAAEQPRRATYDVKWVDIDDPAPKFPYTPGQPAPTTNDQALVYVGDQGRAQGAAYFSRLEGQVYDDNVVYFCSTQGGGAAETGPDPVGGYGNGFGQVWAYHTRARKLQLIYQSPNRLTLDFPDNVTTSKRGTLVLCEDNTEDNYLRGLSRGGQLWDIALNRLTSSTGVDRSGDEFAGSTFSPDGHTLFVNIQASRGMSLRHLGPVAPNRRLTGEHDILIWLHDDGRNGLPRLISDLTRTGAARAPLRSSCWWCCSPCADGRTRRSSWPGSVSCGR